MDAGDRAGDSSSKVGVRTASDGNEDRRDVRRPVGIDPLDEDVTRCVGEDLVDVTAQHDVAPARSPAPAKQDRFDPFVLVPGDCEDATRNASAGPNSPRCRDVAFASALESVLEDSLVVVDLEVVTEREPTSTNSSR